MPDESARVYLDVTYSSDGESVTFEEFVTGRLPALLRYAVMLTGDAYLAEDVVQETLVRVQLKWRRVRRSQQPELYVRRMLTNVFLSWRRTSWFRRTILRSDPVSQEREAAVHDHAQDCAERDEMWLRLATLPRRQRAAIVLRYYENLSDQEIAAVLNCAVSTVRAHISRALTTLRTTMTHPAPQPHPHLTEAPGGSR